MTELERHRQHELKERELRDWFAGMALQGPVMTLYCGISCKPPEIASLAYEIADAMLKERSK